MLKAIVEASNEGITRLEISYHFPDEEALAEFFHDTFSIRIKSDLDLFERALNDFSGTCFRIRLADLLTSF